MNENDEQIAIACLGMADVDIRDHGMDTQDLEFKFFAKRVESIYVVTATYV